MAKIRKEKIYSDDDMNLAINAVKNGKSLRQVAKGFNIPFSTLRSRCNGTYDSTTTKGPCPVLTKEEEDGLAKWMIHRGICGYPQTKEQLLDSVQIICKNLKKKTPFINNRPSRRWYNSFCKRHKELLSLRTRKKLTKKRVTVTEKALRDWFREIANHLESKKLLNINSTRIFNLDERAFFIASNTDNFIVKKGQKVVSNLCNNDKFCLTTLLTCNTEGQMPPGLIMFKGVKLPANITKFLPNSFVAGKSDSGWITGKSFYDYIVNIFYPWCVTNKIEFPVILYVDGRSSHLTLPLSKFCFDKQIELISVYPDATHLMQPLDVALFKPLEKAYKDSVMDWCQDHNGEPLNKENFGTVLCKALNRLDLKKIMNNGFQVSGLYPFSADAINYTKLLGSTSEENDHKNEDAVQNNSNNTHANFFENQIEHETLELFKKSAITGVWSGLEKDRGLYEFWLKTCVNENSCSSKFNIEQTNISDSSHPLSEKENIEMHEVLDKTTMSSKVDESNMPLNKFVLSYNILNNDNNIR